MADNLGQIQMTDSVVASIAGLCASQIKGVAGMSGERLVDGLAKLLHRAEASQGVRVVMGDRDVTIDIHLMIDEGESIPNIARQVQQSVKETVEKMTGLDVLAVNVFVEGIRFRRRRPGRTEEPGKVTQAIEVQDDLSQS